MATSFHLFLKNRKKKNNEYPVYLRITNNRKHKYVSTGVTVKKKQWNPENEEVRRSHDNYKTLNESLGRRIKEVQKAQEELEKSGKYSAKAIQARVKAKYNADFFTYAENYLKEKQDNGKHSQYVQGVVAFNKVEAFEGERYLPFSDIDSDYLERFQNWLQKDHVVDDKKIKGNKASTIKKTFQPIKKVIRTAVRSHLLHADPFTGFDIVTNSNPPSKTKLNIDQIKSIEQLKLDPGSWLWHTRNAFLFSFYSGGIRIGDICCLRWENVKNGRLSYQMNKNDKPFSTNLNDYQKEILSRYQDQHGYVFPFLNDNRQYTPITLRSHISSRNVLVNRGLKTIAEMAGIEEKVSFHVSRHSFAQHAVQQGLDVYELMQTLRHSKLETTQKYLKSLDEELADKAMGRVF